MMTVQCPHDADPRRRRRAAFRRHQDQGLHRGLPFRRLVLSLRQLRDVGPGILERDELAAAGKRGIGSSNSRDQSTRLHALPLRSYLATASALISATRRAWAISASVRPERVRTQAALNFALASTRSVALPRSSPPCGRPWTWQDHVQCGRSCGAPLPSRIRPTDMGSAGQAINLRAKAAREGLAISQSVALRLALKLNVALLRNRGLLDRDHLALHLGKLGRRLLVAADEERRRPEDDDGRRGGQSIVCALLVLRA